jgi:hypothetical protein
MSQEFIETQRRELMTMMQEFWIQRSVNSASSQTQQSSTMNSRSNRWIAANLEFFDFTYDEKFTVTDDSMQHAEKNTYFRDVHFFIDRVKNIVVIKEAETIRNNLYICLRDIAMIWYTAELFEETKKLVRTNNNLDVWERYLIKRFRDRSNVIMIIITKERYIMNDARRRRESREYANVIMKIARSVELKSKSHQIMMIYNDLNLKFQRNISMLTLITQIQNFLQHLDDKKNIWWKLASRNREYNIMQIFKSWVNYNFKSNVIYQSKFHDQFSIYYQFKFDQYEQQWNFEFSSREQFSYQYSANQQYQSQSVLSNAKQLKASKSRLQIIDSDQQNEFAFFSKSYSLRFEQSNNREEYDRRDSLRKAWNNQNRNIYNQSRTQEAYTDATEKNQSMKNSRNDQKQEFISNEFDKKNENSHQIENQFIEEYDYFLNEDEYHIDTKMIVQKNLKIHQCRKCKKEFSFNNKLHQHVRECRKTSKEKNFIVQTFHIEFASERIISSSTKLNITKKLIFRAWHFAIFFARIFKKTFLNELCANSDCIMFLIDRVYLREILSSVKTFHTDDSMTIRDIEIVTHNCFEYVHLKLFISEFKNIVKLSRQAHVVDNLRAKFFMSMNILRFEEIILDISRRKMIFSLCENTEVNIRITSKFESSEMNRIVLIEKLIFILSKCIISILIKMKDKNLSERDYFFQLVVRELNLESFDEIMTHIMSANIIAVQVCNSTEKSVIISRRARLDRIIEYEEHECYAIESSKKLLAAEFFWHKSFALTEIHIKIKEKSLKETSFDEIIVYDISEVRQQLLNTINRFKLSLWDKTENIMMKIFENQWMSITLKLDAKIETTKVYSMSSNERDLIDETFDKLHDQDKMHWTMKFIAHDASIFVVWRMINEEKKDKVVVNIRELNKIVKSDSYSMFLQIDIISAIAECKFIFVVDAAAFFYQFRVQKKNRHKLIVVSHCEQKYFSMTSMSFKNSSAYAQRRINIILRNIKQFCRAFIDDIIIFSNTLKKHVEYLFTMFQRLLDHNIKLNSCKTFLNFSSIALLEQHVDEFDLYAVKDKIAAILNWKFLSTLKTLKIYLRFTKWLRDYVSWYAQKAKSLQQRKTFLLKNSSSQKDFVKKTYFSRTTFQLIDRELKSFELIQKTFKNSRFLTHFNLMSQFFIDVNASKNEFEAFVYHLKRDDMIKFTVIEFIVFLSKILTFVEKRYWSIELEVAVVVWIVKKLHYMIKTSKHLIIIWTDHSATTVIIKQTKLSIINTNKLNLRLVRAVMYLSQFELDVRHKSKRDHVISNALFRLSTFDISSEEITNTLKDVNVYVETLIEMFSNFKTRLVNVYKIDKKWFSLYVMLKNLHISIQISRRDIIKTIEKNSVFLSQTTQIEINKADTDTSKKSWDKSSKQNLFTHDDIEFERWDELIYHLNRFISRARLCISRSLIKKIFRMTHDDFMHVDFHRAHIFVFEILYIRRLAHHLRQYIAYCSQCLLN